jgi:hypothetical protein
MDLDDEIFDSDEDTPDRPDDPDYRATVQRSGAVKMIPWGPWVETSGPAYTLMAARHRAGIAIADLRVIRDDDGAAREVIVKFHSGGGDTHRAALSDWAQAVGYRRVWFDDEVIDLEPSADGPVTTRCTGCGQRYLDGRSGQFWHHVRRSGAFPYICSLCGSDLPQWTPSPQAHIGDAEVRHLAAGPVLKGGRASQAQGGSR